MPWRTLARVRNEDWLVLNVDDSQPIRYAKTRALKRAGFQVMEAESGSEALACVASHRPALVVCDVKLPDISGTEVSRIVKEQFPGTLVLQVSASFVTPRDRAAGLDRGADSYLTEPVEPEELVASVRALLRLKVFEADLVAANSRREFIYSLAEYQRSAETPEAILQHAAASLAERLALSRAGCCELDGPHALRVLACWPGGTMPDPGGDALLGDAADTVREACRTGRTIALGEPHAATRGGAETAPEAALYVPIHRDGRCRAALFLNAAAGRDWTADDVLLAEEVAKLSWDAVVRVRAAQELRRLNESLEERIAERTRELMEAEAQLRQAQKMEAVGQLTGGMAHDFNNLLTGIIGGIGVVRRRMAKGDTRDFDRIMDEVVKSAYTAASLIQRLLVFSRQQALAVAPTDINALVRSMSELVGRTVGENVSIEFDLASDLWEADTDTNQLETALLNLVINARDAMPHGGTITIASSNMSADRASARGGLEPGDYVVLCVRDSGTGMPPEVIERAFDPFFTTKPVGQGTGLGLSMIYGFAKQSRGHVDIDSEIGRGTLVRIYLPRARAKASAAAKAVAPADVSVSLGETILLAEDNANVRGLIAEMLEELNYTVHVAADGQEAAAILASARAIDLLITDVGLPNLNGHQVAEIGRRHQPDLKVLFISGHANPGRAGAGQLPDNAAVIAKPFELEDLAAKVRDMLRTASVQA